MFWNIERDGCMVNKFYSEIVNFLEEGRDEFRKYDLKEKLILLFLGVLGVGKSICINYLKGCVMEEKMDEEIG